MDARSRPTTLGALALMLILYLVVPASYSIIWTNGHRLDETVFIHAGKDMSERWGIDYDSIHVFKDSIGYDGQFYYTIAKNPLDMDAARKIPAPSFRYQRILYPLIVHLLSLGNTRIIPAMFLLLNLASIAAAACIYQRMISHPNAPRASWLYIPLSTGLFVSALLNLTEPLWALLTLASLLMLDRGEHVKSAIFFGLAFLAKETTLYLVLPLILHFVCKKRLRQALIYAAPLILFTAWQLTLLNVFGELPLQSSIKYGASYMGFPDSIAATLRSPSIHRLPVHLLQLTVLPALYVAYHAFRGKQKAFTSMLLFNAVIVFIFRAYSWVDVFAASRNILPLTLLLLIHLAKTGDKRAHFVLMPQALLTIAIGIFYVIKALSILL
jgi:hypothetical protein